MNKKKLITARKKIDQLDNAIFNLIKRRTKVVKYMLSLKKHRNQIVDHKRNNIILKKIRRKSLQHKIAPKITFKIWKSMIWAYVYFQRKNFKKK